MEGACKRYLHQAVGHETRRDGAPCKAEHDGKGVVEVGKKLMRSWAEDGHKGRADVAKVRRYTHGG